MSRYMTCASSVVHVLRAREEAITWELVDLTRDNVVVVMEGDTMPVDITGCPST